jgi:cardiolipin synthase
MMIRDARSVNAPATPSAASDRKSRHQGLEPSITAAVHERICPARQPQRASCRRATLLALSLLLVGCAAVPIIPTPALQNAAAIQPIRMRGPGGPLSQRETRRILQRLSSEAPNADSFQRHLAIEQFVAGTPLYTGNSVSILRDGPQTFAAMFAAIRSAHRYLYLEYYILQDVSEAGQRLSDLLIQQRQQGVLIDIIYDSIGSLSTPSSFFDRLRAAGIQIHQFHPIHALFSLNDRDHRKILIADGSTAIIGGVNFSTDYESGYSHSGSGSSSGSSSGSGSGSDSHGAASSADADRTADGKPAGTGAAISSGATPPGGKHADEQTTPAANGGGGNARWHDTDLQIDGPAVVELKNLFEQHWQEVGGTADQLIGGRDAPGPRGDQVVRIIGSQGGQERPRYYATLLSAIRSATSHIYIEAAYFVPTRQERQALDRAARRKVDVRLLLPDHTDSKAALAVAKSYYSGLLRAGIRIYERDDGILHSKWAVMDGVWSIVGSSNFDHRSVLFNDEVDAVVIGDKTGGELEQFFQQDLQHAHAIELQQWRRRPFSSKLDEAFWRLWQQLL